MRRAFFPLVVAVLAVACGEPGELASDGGVDMGAQRDAGPQMALCAWSFQSCFLPIADECPQQPPMVGTSCAVPDLPCAYCAPGDENAPMVGTRNCADGFWAASTLSCQARQ